ncbi:MAG: hypothetical protein ACOCZ8_01630 [Bacteroidota bacterium]
MSDTPELVKAPCANCGSEMLFESGTTALKCPFCGHQQDIDTTATVVHQERSFHDVVAELSNSAGEGLKAEGRKEYSCDTCGASASVPADQVVIKCEFCGNQTVNEGAKQTRGISPQGLLPFKLKKKQAVENFREWIGKGLFHPNDLKKVTDVKELHEVYVPYWTYDALTYSHWTAEAGYYYYVETTNDKGEKVQERRVRWEPASGSLTKYFDDVLVIASKGVTQHRAERIFPYKLQEAVDYQPEFLLGKTAELYELDVEQGYEVADGIMDDEIRSECARQVPGDTHRNLRVSTNKSNITFKHLLLPMFIAAYIYNDKSYQVVVNGETGKISGEKPLSTIKIIIAVVLGLALVAGLYYAYQTLK